MKKDIEIQCIVFAKHSISSLKTVKNCCKVLEHSNTLQKLINQDTTVGRKVKLFDIEKVALSLTA